MPRYMLGPANRENRMLKGIRVVANPRPVAMYRAPPNVRLLKMEWVYIWVEKTSKKGDKDMSCFPKRTIALFAPRSTSSVG